MADRRFFFAAAHDEGTESDFRPFFLSIRLASGRREAGGAQAARFIAVLESRQDASHVLRRTKNAVPEAFSKPGVCR
ncbi:hypothetical protein ACQUJO_19750 [Ralstonia pseudosolanacearum]